MNCRPRRARMDFLIVESDPRNGEMFRRALRFAAPGSVVNVFPEAGQAIRFLQDTDGGTDGSRPALIVVSLREGDISGCAMIERLRRDEQWRLIPILVFTSSEETEGVEMYYDLKANCCVSRPRDPEEMREVIQSSFDFWLNVARLPDPL